MRKNIKGFTLIELLVTVAIIGLLAAAGFPAIRNAQRNGRDTARLKQAESLSAVAGSVSTKAGGVTPTIPSGSGSITITAGTGFSDVVDLKNYSVEVTVVSTGAADCVKPSAGDLIQIVHHTGNKTVTYCREGKEGNKANGEVINY